MPGQDLQTADTHVVLARNCKSLTLRDLTVNGACLSLGSAGAQTHGIFVEHDCEDVVLERVEVFQTAGDAVRLKGEPAHEVRRVWVQGCRLVQNRRTGVAFQRCVEFVWIRDCYIETIPPSTQAGIDFEPSPPEGPPVLVAPVPLENSQRVWVALGGHETCPRPVLGGLAWRVRWPRRGWRARVCCPAAVPCRGVLSLEVYRAVVLVPGPGSPRAGVHGGESWGIVLACCLCRRNYPWSLRARKIV